MALETDPNPYETSMATISIISMLSSQSKVDLVNFHSFKITYDAMDTLFISGLKLKTRIGVYEWEHDAPQPVIFDLELQTNLQKAAQSGDLKDTIDYALLAEALQQFTLQKHFVLVEGLAEEMAQFIFNNYPVTQLRLKINKIQALQNATGVGLMIERSR